jgi:hypothetical protein
MGKNRKQTSKIVKFSSKSGMARVLGINRGTVASWTNAGDFPGGPNGPWFLPQVIRWLLDRTKYRNPPTDPLLDGPSDGSDALERYRDARAAIAELDLLERQKSLVDREATRAGLLKIAMVLRRAGTRLQSIHGATAAEIFHHALDEAKVMIDREFGSGEEARESE